MGDMNTRRIESAARVLLTESETAQYLSVSRPFLRKARMNGDRTGHAPGPPFLKAGRMIRYRVADLDQWIEAHLVECKPLPGEPK